jgi:hypothetical protein
MVVMIQAIYARHYAFAAVFGVLVLLYKPLGPAFRLSDGWWRAVLLAGAVPFVASLVWRHVRPAHNTKVGGAALRSALTLLLVFAVMSADALAGDLSKYRNFQLGTNLATVAGQAGAHPSQATVIHIRPVLIQELAWRPKPLGWTSETDPVQKAAFSFYDGELFRIVVDYDQYQTEG